MLLSDIQFFSEEIRKNVISLFLRTTSIFAHFYDISFFSLYPLRLSLSPRIFRMKSFFIFFYFFKFIFLLLESDDSVFREILE